MSWAVLGSCSGVQLDCGGGTHAEWKATDPLCLMSSRVKWGSFYFPVTHRVLVKIKNK